jgi:hypothetical protein
MGLGIKFPFFNIFQFTAGDMEFKQNKFLPAEKQVVTANPDINTVSLSLKQFN